MWTFSTIFVLCMGTLSRLLLPENFDIKFFEFLPKMTGRGGLGAISYFSCMGEGTRVSHAKFQVSMSIRSETVVFYKILGVGGEGGGPLLSFKSTKPKPTINAFFGFF